MSSSDDQEQTPLVYSLHVDNSGEPLAERSSSVSNGASSILSRFPTNLERPWHAVACIVGLLLLATITILIMYFCTTALVPAAFPIPRAITKRSADFCDMNELKEELSEYLTPRETQIKFVSDERRIFFVKRRVDNMTKANICALKSAARVGRVYLIVILPHVTAVDELLLAQDSIRDAGLERDVDVMVANAAGFFSESPLSGFDDDEGSRRQELKDFAFKVMVAWRFGGVSYDLDLVTVGPSPKIEPRSVDLDSTATLIEDKATGQKTSSMILKRSPCDEIKDTLNRNANANNTLIIGHQSMTLTPTNKTESREMTLKEVTSKVDPEKVALNASPRIEAEQSTLKTSSKVEERVMTQKPSPKSEILNMVTVKNLPTPDTTAKPSTASEIDSMTLEVSPGIESKTVALDDSREIYPRRRSWQELSLDEHDDNATVSLDGSVLIARQPCHSFVFAVMRELIVSNLSPIPEDVTVSMVVQRALDSFCKGDKGGCNGVKVVPKDKICVRDEEMIGVRCEWVRGGDDGKAWSKYCV